VNVTEDRGLQLSVVVPTYNEVENIVELIERVESALRGARFEVIIVDDGSPDGTADVAESLNEKYGNVVVLRRTGKLGLASAIVEGVKASKGGVVAVMDADLQHPPELLPEMLSKIRGGRDVVIASRYAERGGVKGWSIVRRVVSKGAISLARLLLPEVGRVKDPVSGYFMFRKELLEGLRLEALGYKFLLELLVKRPGAKTAEVPYVFKPRRRGRSKLGLIEYYKYLMLCFKLSKYRPLKFAMVGALGIVVNEGLLHLLVTLGSPMPLASPVAIEASILNNFAWNELWTFKDRRTGKLTIRCLSFHGAVLLGALTNYITLLTLAGLGLHYLMANLIGILLGFLVNYMLSETYVWRLRFKGEEYAQGVRRVLVK